MGYKFDPVAVIDRFKMVGAVLGVSSSMLGCGVVVGVLMTSYENLRREQHEQREDYQREVDDLRAMYRSHSVRMNSHQIDINVLKQRIND